MFFLHFWHCEFILHFGFRFLHVYPENDITSKFQSNNRCSDIIQVKADGRGFFSWL